MNVKSIKTNIIKQSENIQSVLTQYLPLDIENKVLVITSKIISLCEGRVVSKHSSYKKQLVEKEADYILDIDNMENGHTITIKNGILIPSAGIDESNIEDAYILYPIDVHASCVDIWNWIRSTYKVKNIGVLITDSHTTPLRIGVTGIALAWCGFEAQYSYIGVGDIYGKPLKCTKVNVIDALAAASVFVMGEAAEKTPLALISNAPKITYKNVPTTIQDIQNTNIDIKEDLYGPVLNAAKWISKKDDV